ncbi:MAG: hypothetical protein VKI81_12485, partial [Synechococcaceae cyanobacterium]|nr:hypothetical protein [Synechococcaceae cyanobacterium]
MTHRTFWMHTLKVVLLFTAAAVGRTAAQEADSLEIEKLKQQIEAITRQLEELQLGRDVVAEADTGLFGFGPGASKVYKVRQGVSVGGYGEFLYESFADERQDGTPSGARDQLDALRAIIYVGYKFNDRILFNSEIEVEHGSTGQAGSVSLEFAYLDYRLSDAIGVRAGLLLSPMGFVNEQHEPPTFLGTERPETEQRIIPSTWRENGIGVFGGVGRVAFRAYVLNGLDAIGGGPSEAGGFGAAGLRGGRQKGSKALAETFAGVVRADYHRRGFTLGSSVYYGASGQNAPVVSDPTSTIGAETLIWEGHAAYQAHGFDLRGLFALSTVADAELINEAKELEGSASVGERLVG